MNSASENPTVVPLWGVEVGKNYADDHHHFLWFVALSSSAILFSLPSKNPYKFVITGRTKYFINAFGEGIDYG